ncbi:MAG: molecular chaperone [Aquificaceae bacterium]
MSIYKVYLYSFLSLAFSYPSKELLEELRGGLEDLSLSLKNMGIEFDLEALEKVIKEGKERILDLQGEWNALFSTNLKAPANETAYELDKAVRKAWELADIEGFYRAFGVDVRPPVEPDGIVAELEFMSCLLVKRMHLEKENLEEGIEVVDKAYKSFLRDHLGRWYRIFTDLVKESTEEEYYRVMASLLRAFLDTQRDGLEIKDIEEYRREALEGISWKCGI